jgi:hypothetical protein
MRYDLESSPPSLPSAEQRGVSAPPRRGRSVVVLLAALAVAAGALAVDDIRSHIEASDQAQRAQTLGRQLGLEHQRVNLLMAQVNQLQAQNAKLQAEAQNPTLVMWNSCGGPCQIGPDSVRVGSAPDTFELELEFTATVPVRTYFFTLQQWTQFDSCGFSISCVTGSYESLPATTHLDQNFQEAEGCSGYLWVLQADQRGVITPDVKVHYAPADHVTGVCAQSP